jgi:adenylate kinase family enzyme
MSDERDSISYPLGRRINVVGKGGKTTLSKALAERFDLEFIEQDAIRHQANWVELPEEDHRQALAEIMSGAGNGWVCDGNYSGVRDMVYADVDTIIALALPWRVMLWRTFKRSFKRVFTREELWNGNRESAWEVFFTRKSVIYDLWIRRRLFKTIAEWAGSDKPDEARLIVIHTAKELDEFYAEYGLVRG